MIERTGLTEGSPVDHYRVMRLLGRGGTGDVYLARDTRLGRKVALKFLRARSERALVEAEATARFNHPHIVTVYGVGEHQGRAYVALEYLDGKTLRQRLDEERPSLGAVLRIALAIAQALAEAHRNQVLHRDLKPGNVLLPRDGRTRVIDFGLAQPLDSVAAGGTPAYMAPEQWRHEPLSGAADVWPLGLILYELIMGERPLPAASPEEHRALVTSSEPMPRVASGRAPDALVELCARCLAKAPADRPAAGEAAAILQGLLTGAAGRSPEESPFPGLTAFSERQASWFFGRDSEIAAFLERLREEALLLVVGPSGAGKSSFVRAGVIPRLRDQGAWVVLTCRPGGEPFLNLARRLLSGDPETASSSISDPTVTDGEPPARPPTDAAPELARRLAATPGTLSLLLRELAASQHARVLLFVDQLEELYTLGTTADEQRRFLLALVIAADDAGEPVRVCATLRDDFLGRVADSPDACEALSRVVVLRSPGPEALRDMVAGPLEALGYQADDPALLPEMVAAVGREETGLPLLQFAAHLLWERRDRERRRIRRTAYDEMGGVAGALAEHADGVLEGLTPEDVRLARAILLRLVTSEGTRRVLPRSRALEGLGAQAESVLARLVAARLLAQRRGGEAGAEAQVELAHESLARGWRRLARWIEEGREELVFLEELGQAAELWERRGRREAEVWSGEALLEAERMMSRARVELPEEVSGFLEACRRRARRSGRRRRALLFAGLAGLALTAVAAVTIAVSFARQRDTAVRQRAEAQAQRAQAQAEAAQNALVRGDPLEARALMRASLESADSPLARALWGRLAREPLVWSRQYNAGVRGVAVSPGGLVGVVTSGGGGWLVDPSTSAQRGLEGLAAGTARNGVAFSADGLVAATSSSGQIGVWDVEGKPRKIWQAHAGAALRVAFSPDGKVLASTSSDGDVRLWDPRTGGERRRLAEKLPASWSLTFSPDGGRLAAGAADGTLRVWRMASGEVATIRAHDASVRGLAFSAGGDLLASASEDGAVKLWRDGVETRSFELGTAALGVVFVGDRVAVAAGDGSVRILGAESGSEERRLSVHREAVAALAVSAGGARLATGSDDRTVRLWDLSVTGGDRRDAGHTGAVSAVTFVDGGRRLASAGNDRTLRLWDVASGALLRTIDTPSALRRLAAAGDGRLIGVGDDAIHVIDLSTGAGARLARGAEVLAMRVLPDGRVVLCGVDGNVRTLDLASGREVARVSIAARPVGCDAGGGRLATLALDQPTITLWDAVTGARAGELTDPGGAVANLALSADGRRLLSAARDGNVRLWELPGGAPRVLGERASVFGVMFSDDGRRAVAFGSPSTVRAWDLASPGAAVTFHTGIIGELSDVALSPDGALVANGTASGWVRVWEAGSGRPLWRAPLFRGGRRLDAPEGAAWKRALDERAVQAALSHDEARACAIDHDGTIEAWDVRADRRLFAARFPGTGARDVVALARGCVVTGDAGAVVFDLEGRAGEPEKTGGVIAPDGDGALLATREQVLVLDGDGHVAGKLAGAGQVTAVTRIGDRLALGRRSGGLAIAGEERGRAFEGTPDAYATRVRAGPGDTLVAGYADGTVGVWSLATRRALGSWRIHGRIFQLEVVGDTVYATSELGDSLVLDLRALGADYCALLREVWEKVPVVWENGRPVVKPPPGNRCR